MSGLKLYLTVLNYQHDIVSPYIGEWIEISYNSQQEFDDFVSPYIGEWIEISVFSEEPASSESHLT